MLNNMLITKTQLNDIIKNAPSGTTPQQIVNGLIARGYILEGYNEKSGILKNIGREIAKPFVQGAELLGQAALTTKAVAKAGYQSATGQKEAAGKTILSEAKRIEKSRKQPIRLLGGDVERVKTMKEAAGTTLNLASNFVGGSGAIKAGTAGVKTGLLSTIKTGAMVGAKSGALYGTGEALSEDRNVIRGALGGALGGSATGVILPAAIGGIIKTAKVVTSPFSTAINKIAPALDKAAIKVENVITKATKQDIKHGFKTENVFKYDLGGSLGSSLQKTENLIGELSAKAENLRANAKSNINLNEIVSSVADELSSNKVRNIGNNKRILNSFKVFVKELEDVAPDGKMNTIDAQKVKVALGKMGSWLNGQRDLDANADEVVANALYTKFKTAIERAVDDPAELKEINKQLSEIIPIQNVLLKRIPIAERNAALSLSDIITAGTGAINPKGWGLFAVNRLSRSGKFAEKLYKGSQKLKAGATKFLPLEIKLKSGAKNIKPGLTIKNVGKKQLLNKTDDLIQEAKKYKTAEEFVDKNIDDYVKNTDEYKNWARGSKNIIEAYHGTPYSFDNFEIGKKQAGAYELDSISFATKKELAEPFSRQYPDWFYDKKKIIENKYRGIDEIKDKLKKIDRQSKIRSVDEIKKEGREIQSELKKEWEDKKDWLFNNNYEKFKGQYTYSFGRLKELEDELNRARNIDDIKITQAEKTKLRKYEKELNDLENEVSGNVYKVYIKGKNIIDEIGEEIGFGSTRNQIVADLDGDILRIKDADTGQYIGEEIIVNDPSQIFIVNSPKNKSQLTEIWNKAHKLNQKLKVKLI